MQQTIGQRRERLRSRC